MRMIQSDIGNVHTAPFPYLSVLMRKTWPVDIAPFSHEYGMCSHCSSENDVSSFIVMMGLGAKAPNFNEIIFVKLIIKKRL